MVNLKCNQSQLNKTIPFYCPMTHTPFTFPQSHPISSTPISLSFILLMYHSSTQSLSSLSFQSFFFLMPCRLLTFSLSINHYRHSLAHSLTFSFSLSTLPLSGLLSITSFFLLRHTSPVIHLFLHSPLIAQSINHPTSRDAKALYTRLC